MASFTNSSASTRTIFSPHSTSRSIGSISPCGAAASTRTVALVAVSVHPSASILTAREYFWSFLGATVSCSGWDFSGWGASEGVAAPTMPAMHSAITATPRTAAATMRRLRLGEPPPSTVSPCAGSDSISFSPSIGSVSPSIFSSV